ncbi:gamma carbonic anhydrase family protein [uncultured Oscillibacter sp.]|jgi:carbonic anhydrase/acetyltransferase-like protein (isoleucine patch superfamily)|uniref:gamma carbonic anhydrase family protein n=1 Tax=Dysosmobacter sp. TaxID=2591382 RepID=UPI00280600A2|nr:gamma carbonic anhydrase family protein [uncultured Oscillibacter sp.]
MDYKKRTSDPDVLIAEGAVVVGDVKLAKGVSVWYNAVLRGDESPIEVGENTNIQDGAILHARAVVGSNCTVGHCAIIHGCTVGSHTLIGMGSILLDGAKIGNHCIVGAGALVTGKLDAPDGSMILGSPAKVVRPLTQEEMDSVDASVQEYLEFAQHYRASHE